MDKQDALNKIEEVEKTDSAYIKIGNEASSLIVSFASNSHSGFDRKTSLMELKYKRHDFDVLYLRNAHMWYLGGLKGIGNNIDHTVAFLKREIQNYDRVLFTGASSGGYASLLFGSLLSIHSVVAADAQTDLEYLVENIQHLELTARKKECPITWDKYNKIEEVLSDNVNYYVYYKGDNACPDYNDITLHGDYHYNLIKDFPNVSRIGHVMGEGVLIEFLDS